MASSRGPAIGMNSGMRSIGEAIQTAAKPSQIFELRGTLGSLSSPRNRIKRFGIKVEARVPWTAGQEQRAPKWQPAR